MYSMCAVENIIFFIFIAIKGCTELGPFIIPLPGWDIFGSYLANFHSKYRNHLYRDPASSFGC